MTVSTGVIQAPQALNTPATQEFISVTTPYNMGVNRTNRRVSRTGVKGSNPSDSGSGNSAVDRCPSPTPPYICICNGSIWNIGQTVNGSIPSLRDTSKFHTSIDGRFPNDYNVMSVVSQIIVEEFSVSYGSNTSPRSRMDVTAETVQPMGPQLIIHGLLTIDTLN